MNFCKDCKHFGGMRMGPSQCRNPKTTTASAIWGPLSINASQARAGQQPCGPDGQLFEPSRWVRTVALFKTIGGFV